MKKVQQKIVLTAFLFATFVVLAACSRGDISCYCKSSTSNYVHKLGKRVEWQEALARCGQIQNDGKWDTCMVMEPK